MNSLKYTFPSTTADLIALLKCVNFYEVEIRRVSITIHKESFQKVTHRVNVNINKALDGVVIKI